MASEIESEEDIGPSIDEASFNISEAIAEQATNGHFNSKTKKLKTLQFEKLYLDALPSAKCYELSYMHRDVVTHVSTTKTGFLITASQDGHIKFWKKAEQGIEFVKHFKAHLNCILDCSVSIDGTLYSTISEDQTLKIFDVINFDMINQHKLDYIPITCEWVCPLQDPLKSIALSHSLIPHIYIYDAYGETPTPIHVYTNIHRAPIVSITFNPVYEIAISVDESGMIEYWTGPKHDYKDPLGENSEKFGLRFEHKTDTDLYELARMLSTKLSAEHKAIAAKEAQLVKSGGVTNETQLGTIHSQMKKFLRSCVISSKLGFSPDGQYFSLLCFNDEKIRVFRFDTGRLWRVFDENKQALSSGITKANNLFLLENRAKAKLNQQNMTKRILAAKKQKMDLSSDAPNPEESLEPFGDHVTSSSDEGENEEAKKSTKSKAKKKIEQPLISTIDFNRRLQIERELLQPYFDATPNDNDNSLDLESVMLPRTANVCFDASGKFILYATILGIRMINLVTNKSVRLFGVADNLRFLNLALFQGRASVKKYLENTVPDAITLEMEATTDSFKPVPPDPVLFATAFRKNRFYLFSQREPQEDITKGIERDIFNEKPSKDDMLAVQDIMNIPGQILAGKPGTQESSLSHGAIIHTHWGDINVKLYPEQCPKTVLNFCTHARNGYYNGHIFHRVIKGFMVQTGDPTGTGTGGESIWGGDFEDEISPTIRHDKPYTLSMANAGPNTNGSQFFITVVPCPWLDGKHTVFGLVTKGMSVINRINSVKTDEESDKPITDVSIMSITIK